MESFGSLIERERKSKDLTFNFLPHLMTDLLSTLLTELQVLVTLCRSCDIRMAKSIVALTQRVSLSVITGLAWITFDLRHLLILPIFICTPTPCLCTFARGVHKVIQASGRLVLGCPSLSRATVADQVDQLQLKAWEMFSPIVNLGLIQIRGPRRRVILLKRNWFEEGRKELRGYKEGRGRRGASVSEGPEKSHTTDQWNQVIKMTMRVSTIPSSNTMQDDDGGVVCGNNNFRRRGQRLRETRCSVCCVV